MQTQASADVNCSWERATALRLKLLRQEPASKPRSARSKAVTQYWSTSPSDQTDRKQMSGSHHCVLGPCQGNNPVVPPWQIWMLMLQNPPYLAAAVSITSALLPAQGDHTSLTMHSGTAEARQCCCRPTQTVLLIWICHSEA